MSKIPIRVVRGHESAFKDPTPIPTWFDDPEEIGPCPCGQPPDDSCMLIEGDTPLKRWFHIECLDWLESEMTDEEIEEKHEWERRMRESDDE